MESEFIENIFRTSNDNNELFDAFESAIAKGLDNFESYKILLSNPALSNDEICMFTEKLIKVFEDKQYDILMWTADVLSSYLFNYENIERAYSYYIKAAQSKPEIHQPYLSLLDLFSYDFDSTLNNNVISFVESGIPKVDKKSILFKNLAKHYKKVGDLDLHNKYSMLAKKAAERE